MLLDLTGAGAPEAGLGVADEAVMMGGIGCAGQPRSWMGGGGDGLVVGGKLLLRILGRKRIGKGG